MNIMRDIPRPDTKPEAHAHLMLCMFKPFFSTTDLGLARESSWVSAMVRADEENSWDPRSKTMRSNIKGMLTQRLAADEEMTRRRQEQAADRAAYDDGTFYSEDIGEMLNFSFDDDDDGTNSVMKPLGNAHAMK